MTPLFRRDLARICKAAFQRQEPFDVINRWNITAGCERQAKASRDTERARQFAVCAYLLRIAWIREWWETPRSKLIEEGLDATAIGVPPPSTVSIELEDTKACLKTARKLEKKLLGRVWERQADGEWNFSAGEVTVIFFRLIEKFDETPSLTIVVTDQDERLVSEAGRFFAVDAEAYLWFDKPDTFEERYEKFLMVVDIFRNEVARIALQSEGGR